RDARKSAGAELTTGAYCTPSGRSIEGKGIEPDILSRQYLSPEHQEEKPPRRGDGHLRREAQSDPDVASAYIVDNGSKDQQLTAAIDFLHSLDVGLNPKPAPNQPNR